MRLYSSQELSKLLVQFFQEEETAVALPPGSAFTDLMFALNSKLCSHHHSIPFRPFHPNSTFNARLCDSCSGAGADGVALPPSVLLKGNTSLLFFTEALLPFSSRMICSSFLLVLRTFLAYPFSLSSSYLFSFHFSSLRQCGGSTTSIQGGVKRLCVNEKCKQQHYPR